MKTLRKCSAYIAAFMAIVMCVGMLGVKVAKADGGMHTVTFVYGDKETAVLVADHGNAIVPTDTQVDGYTFTGWVGNALNVTEDRIILGAYIKNDAVVKPITQSVPVQNSPNAVSVNNNVSAPTPNVGGLNKGVPGQTCAVHWYNGWTGALIRDDIVPYGSTIYNIPDPTCNGLQFTGWEGSWSNITEDRSIKAWYFQVHKVTFIDALTGAEFNTQYVRDGEDASLPQAPHHNGYHFEGISGDYRNVREDRKIYVYFDSDYSYHDERHELWWLDVDIDDDGPCEDDEFWWLG